jgi:uncharacterized protein involved in outer membrane biogenesis
MADTELKVRGKMAPATAAEHLELDGQLQGETLNTLGQLLDIELPKAGPYQLSFHAHVAEGSYTLTALEGNLNNIGLWKTIRILRGKASALDSGSVKASMDVKLDNIPLSLLLQGGPEISGQAGATIWPVKLEASASGAILKGDGSVVIAENRMDLQIATRTKGNRFESLGPLMGLSLPAMGRFNISADFSSDGDVHEAGNLKIQVGANRVTGSARWEDKAPRPLITGKLSADRLMLGELLSKPSKPSSKTGEVGLLDHPITLDNLKDFDAGLDIHVKRLAEDPIHIADLRFAVTLANGELSAPFRATVAGTPMDGQIQVSRPKNMPGVSLTAQIGRIDVGQTLKQLELPEIIAGTAEAVDLDGSSTGKTLRELYQQAEFTLQVNPAKLRYTAKIADQSIDVMIESAEFDARKGRPVSAVFKGTLRGVPFNATVSAGTLVEMLRANVPLPVRMTLQTPNVQFKTEGTIARTFKFNEFDLKYELSGKEIQGLDPLVDFALPLQGAFHTRGRVTARGHQYTYEEDLQVGKSDLKANITVLRKPPRPQITGTIFARELHLDDLRFFRVDEDAGPAGKKSRVIPDYTVPVDVLSTTDLDLNIKAERISSRLGDFGEFVSKVSLKKGHFKSSSSVRGLKGARFSSELYLNAGVEPPMVKIQLTAKGLNYGFFLRKIDRTELVEGQTDLYVDLSGSGATRHSFLGDAEGRITIIGGPGRIPGQRIELWAADLIPTMLSPRWQREEVTEINCFVTHISLKEGLAEIDDLLLDTRRTTIAASGKLDLETEVLKMVIAPRPKRASLVSLANPVAIGGTLSKPEVSVTRLPSIRVLEGSGFGILAGLVNPAFLIFSFSDAGTGTANPCDAAIERVHDAFEAGSQ